MFLVRVSCGNGHQWDEEAGGQEPSHPSLTTGPKCPQCGASCNGPVDPPDVTFKMHLRRKGNEVQGAPIITIR